MEKPALKKLFDILFLVVMPMAFAIAMTVVAIAMAIAATFATATTVAMITTATLVSATSLISATLVTTATAVFILPLAVMIAIVMAFAFPMVVVFCFAAVADNYLVSAAAVIGIPCTVNIVTFPWVTLVNHHFVTVVQIVIAIPGRQVSAVYPHVVFIINVLMRWNRVISIDIGHVVIIRTIITYGTPCRLTAYIKPDAYMHLCFCYLDG
jgi:hypothetical protein